MAAGTPALDAQSGGITAAFFCGAVISIFAIIAAFFIRKPAEQAGGPMMGH
jgi:DHA2 family lincomycin resistance protein-like MFS transporter